MFCLCTSLLLNCCTNKSIPSFVNLMDINVYHDEYTGSLDAIISNEPFSYPDSIKKYLADTSMKEVILEGKNPYSSRGAIMDFFNDNRLMNRYKLSGYFTRVDSTNNNSVAEGTAAVFYVVRWEKIKSKKQN